MNWIILCQLSIDFHEFALILWLWFEVFFEFITSELWAYRLGKANQLIYLA